MSGAFTALLVIIVSVAFLIAFISIFSAIVNKCPALLSGLILLIIPICLGGVLVKNEGSFTVDTPYVEKLQREIKLHYPELRRTIHDKCSQNEWYGLTIKQYKEIQQEMRIIDGAKLTESEGTEL